MKRAALLLPLILTSMGCANQDIQQAYRRRMFHRTGAFAFYGGGSGFDGPVLDPGTYYTGSCDELHMVQCTVVTLSEPLNALTKDVGERRYRFGLSTELSKKERQWRFHVLPDGYLSSP